MSNPLCAQKIKLRKNKNKQLTAHTQERSDTAEPSQQLSNKLRLGLICDLVGCTWGEEATALQRATQTNFLPFTSEGLGIPLHAFAAFLQLPFCCTRSTCAPERCPWKLPSGNKHTRALCSLNTGSMSCLTSDKDFLKGYFISGLLHVIGSYPRDSNFSHLIATLITLIAYTRKTTSWAESSQTREILTSSNQIQNCG